MIRKKRIEEKLEPTPAGICPECYRKMIERPDRYICFKCGITIYKKKGEKRIK